MSAKSARRSFLPSCPCQELFIAVVTATACNGLMHWQTAELSDSLLVTSVFLAVVTIVDSAVVGLHLHD